VLTTFGAKPSMNISGEDGGKYDGNEIGLLLPSRQSQQLVPFVQLGRELPFSKAISRKSFPFVLAPFIGTDSWWTWH
jgi:hypothetical protein